MRVNHHLFVGLLDIAVLVTALLGAEVDHFEDALPWLFLPGGSCGTGCLFASGAGLHLDVEGRGRWRRRSLNSQWFFLNLMDGDDIVVFLVNFLGNSIANLRPADPLNKTALSHPILLILPHIILQTCLKVVPTPQQHAHQQSLQHL